ncbi:MAG: hypothetical protein Q4G71_13720 [Pseudomonadota bacterium]|nr:hypothetical protein [Pseudomonadota bacterium]
MKMQVIGFEIIAGTSKKTGNAYDMSKVHTLIPLEQTQTAKGAVGTSYDCPSHVLEKIRHLAPPLLCEVEMQDVQRFGARQQQIASIVPADRATASDGREIIRKAA